MQHRCAWCTTDPLYQQYHDEEWGVPLMDDLKLFELLNLEGMQAGLSWLTILKKRENYRQAFNQFDPSQIILFKKKKIQSLLTNPGIIRNALKVNAIINNAHAYLRISEQQSFAELLWSFVNFKPISNKWHTHANIPTFTPHALQMSKVLKKLGFKFVGETICYAFMQSAGMVNDHLTKCYRYQEVVKLQRSVRFDTLQET